MNPFTTEPADLLTVILDLNPLAWADIDSDHPDDGSMLISVIESFLIFANSHLALRHENMIAVYGATPTTSQLLFSSAQAKSNVIKTPQAPVPHDANTYQTFAIVNDSIVNGVKQLASSTQSMPSARKQSGIVKALAKALCHINSTSKENDVKKDPLKSRILIISVSADAPGHYIPMMNCIFSAQKDSIPIDVCKISTSNAVFLQQAAHLTDGIYYQVENIKAILQYLTINFLPGIAARKLLNLPRQEQVDFRAACFCHREIIDIGYVCSVCLSIFCTPTPFCSTCRTKFSMSSLKRFLLEKPKARTKSANGEVNTTAFIKSNNIHPTPRASQS